MDHSFTGTPFTLGIEEELMLVDRESLELAHGIEAILADVGEDAANHVKPELMESVLEICTEPHSDLAAATVQLGEIRSTVRASAERNEMLTLASGTHPTGMTSDQRIVDRPRYHQLVAELGWIARQELIFGTHVHVGVTGPDRAIYIADGIRRHLPLLLAISANSPLWQGEVTGLMSTRTPIFRHFPRVGIPPHYGSWEIYEGRVELMMRAGAIPDYSFLWWDVRPHPKLGTVELRVFDQQTRLEHTVALAALSVCLVHRYSSNFDDGKPMVEVPTELIDDNKVRAAIQGLEGNLIDLPADRNAPAAELAHELVSELEPDAAELGCSEALGVVRQMIDGGTGARRQLEVFEDGGPEELLRYLRDETGA